MRHVALNCAARYCIVDQVVLDVRILTELIWILRSNCLNSQLGLSSSSKEDEYTEEKELKIQISSGKTSAPRGPRGLIDDHEYGGGGDAESQPTRAQDPNQFRGGTPSVMLDTSRVAWTRNMIDPRTWKGM